jgi:hypothetical protein
VYILTNDTQYKFNSANMKRTFPDFWKKAQSGESAQVCIVAKIDVDCQILGFQVLSFILQLLAQEVNSLLPSSRKPCFPDRNATTCPCLHGSSPPPLLPSRLLRPNGPSPIDLQINTSNEFPLITRQESSHISDILRICQSPQRHIEQEFLHVFLGVRDADELLE